MRFPAQYRPSETSHISLNDHFAAMQIDWPSEGGNGYRLTRSSLTPRISSRTIDPPVRGHPRPGKTAISYHNRQRCVNVPRPSTQGLSTVTLATLRPVQPVCECLERIQKFHRLATLANLSTVTLATLRPVQPVGECYSVASLTVCECPKIPSTRNTRQLIHCYTRNTTLRPASGQVLQCCEFDSVRVSRMNPKIPPNT